MDLIFAKLRKQEFDGSENTNRFAAEVHISLRFSQHDRYCFNSTCTDHTQNQENHQLLSCFKPKYRLGDSKKKQNLFRLELLTVLCSSKRLVFQPTHQSSQNQPEKKKKHNIAAFEELKTKHLKFNLTKKKKKMVVFALHCVLFHDTCFLDCPTLR